MEALPLDPAVTKAAAAAAVGGDLEPVADTTDSPWREVCRLVIEDSSHRELATGWLISPTVVVTARHAFLHTSNPRISVSPGFNDGHDPFGTFFSQTVREAIDGSDCAAVFLSQPVDTTRIGTFGFRVTNAPVPEAVAVIGYITRDGGDDQYTGEGRVLDLRAELKYDIATKKGQSGGPVCSTSAPRTVVAIHKDFQVATPITESLFEQLRRWQQAGTGAIAGGRHAASAAGAVGLAAPTLTASMPSTAPHRSDYVRLGTELGTTLNSRLGAGRVTVVIGDDSVSAGLTFEGECVLAGLVQSLKAKVFAPQLRQRLDGDTGRVTVRHRVLLIRPSDGGGLSAIATLLAADRTVLWSAVYGVDTPGGSKREALRAPKPKRSPARGTTAPRKKR